MKDFLQPSPSGDRSLEKRVEDLERRLAQIERGQINPFMTFGHPRTASQSDCLFDRLSPEDRNKPMGLVCQCRRCSAFSFTV